MLVFSIYVRKSRGRVGQGSEGQIQRPHYERKEILPVATDADSGPYFIGFRCELEELACFLEERYSSSVPALTAFLGHVHLAYTYSVQAINLRS